MITFTVNEQAADYILKALAQRPFGEVADLMNDLVQQARAQQEALAAAALGQQGAAQRQQVVPISEAAYRAAAEHPQRVKELS